MLGLFCFKCNPFGKRVRFSGLEPYATFSLVYCEAEWKFLQFFIFW